MSRGLMALFRNLYENIGFIIHKFILRIKLHKLDDSYGRYLDLQLRRSLSKSENKLPDRAKFFIDKISSLITLEKLDVLCVGCRNVEELNCFRSKGAMKVVGIDLFSKHKDIIVMDMHNLIFSENSFDFIYSSHSLEHSLKPEFVVDEMVRVVKPGGYIAVEVPICFNANGADMYDFKTLDNLLKFFQGYIDHVLWSDTELSKSVRAVIKIYK